MRKSVCFMSMTHTPAGCGGFVSKKILHPLPGTEESAGRDCPHEWGARLPEEHDPIRLGVARQPKRPSPDSSGACYFTPADAIKLLQPLSESARHLAEHSTLLPLFASDLVPKRSEHYYSTRIFI